MFYGKDSIEEDFDVLLNKLEEQELFVFKPMPIYKHGERWTDEFRIRDGHTKLADGSWVTIIKVTTLIEKLKQDTIETYENYQDSLRKNRNLAQQRMEMEFGLRHAQKSLNTALAMKGYNDE
jgi:hypothetical protein